MKAALPLLAPLVLAVSAALAAAPVVAAEVDTQTRSLWTPLAKRGDVPGRLLSLDEAELRRQLSVLDAPSAALDKQTLTVWLPIPDGSFQAFRVSPSVTMAPELAQRYPELRTYKGEAIDGLPRAVRFELMPDGFSAMFFAPDGVALIRPTEDKSAYQSVFRDDLPNQLQASFQCGYDPERHGLAGLHSHGSPSPAPNQAKRVGSEVRVYRTAIAATKEFTAANGGTVAGAMAEIVRAVSRINQPFENDLGVAVQLIANNDQLIFTEANPGNFVDTTEGQSAMLDQNQTLLDTQIGAANYDLGHLFGNSGGGLAAIGPCNSSSKAQGFTGQAGLSGDAFWIDYVAHEFGHQFGADHTYNDSGTGGCTTRVTDSAYEPASGSTIMSYVGICGTLGAANLQGNADPYYHVRSLEQIHGYTQDSTGGAQCGTTRSTGNQPPSLTSVPGTTTIPARTPFALTAAASDPNGDALTFGWEQYDLGPASPPVSDDGQRPIFRSFTPTSSPTRTFPRLADVLAGTQTFGEALPTTNRTLTFRVTVRDNKSGGGGVEWSGSSSSSGFPATALTVVDTGAAFALTSQAQTESLTAGQALNVTWNVAGTASAPISCANVRIDWSSNGGQSFSTVLASTPNNGSASITVPGPATSTARLRVQCASSVFFAINAANLTVTGDGGGGGGDLIFRNGFE